MPGTVLATLRYPYSKYFHHLQEVGIQYFHFKHKARQQEKLIALRLT